MSVILISERLKASLLQSAIQGKLTQQLPDDGDARDLLKQIETEKERLITEKVIKKEKPLPEITEDEIPFDIPDNWVWVKLGEILQLISGQDLTTNDYSNINIGIPYITGASNFQNNTLIINRWTNNPRSIAFKNDLLLTCKGTVGDMAFLSEDRVHIARQIMAISDRVHKLNLNYIKIVLSNYINYLKSIAKSMIPGINRNDVLSCLIPLPPLAEQHRIVDAIETALAKIDKLKVDETKLHTIQTAFPNKLRASLLQSAIQGKLTQQLPDDGDARDLLKQIEAEKERLIKEKVIKKEKPLPKITEDEIPFDIPNNWVWVRLGSIGITNIGLTYDKKNISIHGTIILRSENIQNNRIKLQELVKINSDIPDNKKCYKGDLLICARNGSRKLVGKSAIVEHNGMSFGAFMALFRSICNPFIHYFLQSPFYRENLDGVRTTTINQITQDNLKQQLIPLPPLAEQHRIVDAIETALAKIDKLNKLTKC